MAGTEQDKNPVMRRGGDLLDFSENPQIAIIPVKCECISSPRIAQSKISNEIGTESAIEHLVIIHVPEIVKQRHCQCQFVLVPIPCFIPHGQAVLTAKIPIGIQTVQPRTMADRIAVMNDGLLEAYDTPDDLYEHPKTLFIASFVGNPPMNILPGTIDGPGIVALGDAILEARDLRQDLPAQTPVEVGLRPEDVELASEGEAGSLPFDVEFIEELGATQLFHGQLAGLPFVMQAATDMLAAQAGRIWISVDPDRVHVFDSTTGARLGRV